jgi:hypothetical protein
VIYSQIAPKIMRWHHVFRTKTHRKWMRSQINTKIFQNMDEMAKFG